MSIIAVSRAMCFLENQSNSMPIEVWIRVTEKFEYIYTFVSINSELCFGTKEFSNNQTCHLTESFNSRAICALSLTHPVSGGKGEKLGSAPTDGMAAKSSLGGAKLTERRSFVYASRQQLCELSRYSERRCCPLFYFIASKYCCILNHFKLYLTCY